MSEYSVHQHFQDRVPALRQTYDALLRVSRRFGAVVEEPKKTSIHLVARSAFAGIALRKNELILTIKSATDIQSSRIRKREQTSARRWHLEVRLSDPKQVDAEIERWIGQAFEISK
jgi:hypothetical protein